MQEFDSGVDLQPEESSLVSLSVLSARTTRGLLLVGYLCFALAVRVATQTPANGYELSIYTATPARYWLLSGGAVVGAIAVVVYAPRAQEAVLAAMLLTLAVGSFVALPIIRGYHYYGLGDSLVHLAIARKLSTGVVDYFDVLYPGTHTFALLFRSLSGWGTPQSFLLVVVAITFVFIAFVPLCVWVLLGDRRAVVIALFSSLLLLPIFNVSTILAEYPFSLSTFFVPLVVYLVLTHVCRRAEDETLPSYLAATSLVLPLVLLAQMLYHPQVMLNVIILLGTIAAVQAVYRRWRPTHPIGRSRAIYGQFIIAAVVFFGWATHHWQFAQQTQRTLSATVGYFSGTSETVPQVQERADAGRSVGFSLPELFVKLFAVEFGYLALSAGLVLWRATGWFETKRDEVETALVLFGVGALTLTPLVLVQMVGDVSHHFFRNLGYVLVFVTILGAVALYQLARVVTWRHAKTATAIVAVVVLVLSLATVYPSPTIYKHNQHVPESHMAGYQSSFEHLPENSVVWFGSVRGIGFEQRYKGSLASKPGTSWYPGIVRPFPRSSGPVTEQEMLDGLPEHYATHNESIVRRDHYLPITAVGKQRELGAYNGFRYSERAFEAVERRENIHRVQANDEYTLYYVDVPSPEYGPDSANESVNENRAVPPVRAPTHGS